MFDRLTGKGRRPCVRAEALQAEKSGPKGEKHGRRPQMVWLYLFL